MGLCCCMSGASMDDWQLATIAQGVLENAVYSGQIMHAVSKLTAKHLITDMYAPSTSCHFQRAFKNCYCGLFCTLQSSKSVLE
eukprot:1087258-Pleurochrysis_carterae.AAC.1